MKNTRISPSLLTLPVLSLIAAAGVAAEKPSASANVANEALIERSRRSLPAAFGTSRSKFWPVPGWLCAPAATHTEVSGKRL